MGRRPVSPFMVSGRWRRHEIFRGFGIDALGIPVLHPDRATHEGAS